MFTSPDGCGTYMNKNKKTKKHEVLNTIPGTKSPREMLFVFLFSLFVAIFITVTIVIIIIVIITPEVFSEMLLLVFHHFFLLQSGINKTSYIYILSICKVFLRVLPDLYNNAELRRITLHVSESLGEVP